MLAIADTSLWHTSGTLFGPRAIIQDFINYILIAKTSNTVIVLKQNLKYDLKLKTKPILHTKHNWSFDKIIIMGKPLLTSRWTKYKMFKISNIHILNSRKIFNLNIVVEPWKNNKDDTHKENHKYKNINDITNKQRLQ